MHGTLAQHKKHMFPVRCGTREEPAAAAAEEISHFSKRPVHVLLPTNTFCSVGEARGRKGIRRRWVVGESLASHMLLSTYTDLI